MSDMMYGFIIGMVGILLFIVGASTLRTIYWVGVMFILSAMACMGFGIFVIASSNEQLPSLRGF